MSPVIHELPHLVFLKLLSNYHSFIIFTWTIRKVPPAFYLYQYYYSKLLCTNESSVTYKSMSPPHQGIKSFHLTWDIKGVFFALLMSCFYFIEYVFFVYFLPHLKVLFSQVGVTSKFSISDFLKRGMLTWPNEDDWMNLTKICEHDQKIDNDKP